MSEEEASGGGQEGCAKDSEAKLRQYEKELEDAKEELRLKDEELRQQGQNCDDVKKSKPFLSPKHGMYVYITLVLKDRDRYIETLLKRITSMKAEMEKLEEAVQVKDEEITKLRQIQTLGNQSHYQTRFYF